MSSLYELGNEYEILLDVIDNQGGEITPEQEKQLFDLERALTAKIDDYIGYISELEQEAEKLKALKMKYGKKQQTRENTIDRLKRTMLEQMELRQTDCINGNIGKVRKQFSEAINFDAAIVPVKYIDYKPVVKVSEIKQDLKAGKEIPGAVLERKPYVRIY